VQLASAYPTGTPIKYVFNGNTYYGMLTACTTSLMTIRGPPLSTGSNLLTALSVGDISRVIQVPVSMPGFWDASTVSTYINSNLLVPSGFPWNDGTAYCVGYDFVNGTADGSSNAYVQLVVNGNNVCSTGSTGMVISSTSIFSTGVAVNTVSNTNITIGYGQFFEISVTKGTGGDATNGRLTAIFVIP
jgi:hypothetical protein